MDSSNTIRELLSSGTSIICDRYYHSGIVYSAAKNNPSLNLQWAHAPEHGLPRPDRVVFLDLDEEQAKKRGGWGGEVYEKAEMQKRVKELFWALSEGGKGEKAKELGMDGGSWTQEQEDLAVVDAGRSVEDVAEGIWVKVRETVERVGRGELGREVRVVQ